MEIIGLIEIIIGLGIYFIPTFVAYDRKMKNKESVLWLNLLLGWTFIGWVVALIWSLIKSESNESKITLESELKKCPKCAELIKKEATKCKHCGSEL